MMNNFEKLKECRSISEMAFVLAFTDLAEILEVEQPIPDSLREKMALFYRNLEEPPKCPVCGKPCKFLKHLTPYSYIKK